MATGAEGALRGWYDIHTALRTELGKLVALAKALDPTDQGTISACADHWDFFRDVLATHSAAEDGVVFAAMRARGLDVPEALTQQHHDELDRVYDVHHALLTVRWLADTVDPVAVVAQVRDGVGNLQRELGAHIDFEDQHLVPEVLDAFSEQEQRALLGNVMGNPHTVAEQRFRDAPLPGVGVCPRV